jgi:phage shock protein PspC (stress-responsive transcriptional regulator)
MNENEQRTANPHTGLDKIFSSLRGMSIRRRTDDKWIGGVSSGLADRLGVDPVIVRVALVVLSLFWGFGITVYLAAWVLLPNDKNEIVAERAIRDGDGGSVVLLIFAAFALFGALTWSGDTHLAFPFLMVPLIVFVWWLTHRSHDRPDADARVHAQRTATPYAAPTPFYAGQPQSSGPMPATSGPMPATSGPMTTTYRPQAPRKLRRRSGGGLMALLALGLALVTYGSLSWLGSEFHWTGSHWTIAMAGSLVAIGLLLVVLGLAGWRAGFVGFLAVVLAITAWSSAVVPVGIHLGGPVGDRTWTPALVTSDASYRLSAGDAVLNLGGLPKEGLSEAKLPVYVGIGDLKVVVPEGLTVKIVGHVGLGEILLPSDLGTNGQGGTDVGRSVVIGDGPTEVVVDAGVGVGQLTVVKE